MIYLSGHRTSHVHRNLGFMTSPRIGQLPFQGEWWALDNGCYSDPGGFSIQRYLGFIQRLAPFRETCLFVTAPDVPFDAEGTVARWQEYGAGVRALGFPVAFVTQDGMGIEDVPWGDCDALFVGGSTRWKLGHESTSLITHALQLLKWVHVGRVNSLKRLRAAQIAGAQSVDGTYLKFGPDTNWPSLQSWLGELEVQPSMVLPS